jgi:hypothetical protein
LKNAALSSKTTTAHRCCAVQRSILRWPLSRKVCRLSSRLVKVTPGGLPLADGSFGHGHVMEDVSVA